MNYATALNPPNQYSGTKGSLFCRSSKIFNILFSPNMRFALHPREVVNPGKLVGGGDGKFFGGPVWPEGDVCNLRFCVAGRRSVVSVVRLHAECIVSWNIKISSKGLLSFLLYVASSASFTINHIADEMF